MTTNRFDFLKNKFVVMRSPDAWIAGRSVEKYLSDCQRILIIGDAGGRDWQNFQNKGKQIAVLDIAFQSGIPDMVVQSIEDRTPWADETFDGVVLGEVLEHLLRDYDALCEIHRILKPAGVLALTVPCISNVQDEPEFHVQVFTERIIKRLLRHTGFEVRDSFMRGIFSHVVHVKPLGSLIFGTQKLVELLGRKSPEAAVAAVNDRLLAWERFLGRNRLLEKIQRLFPSYGIILKAVKVEGVRDNHAIQRDHFQDVAFGKVVTEHSDELRAQRRADQF